MMEYCTFQFHSIVTAMISMHIYGDIFQCNFTYFDISVLLLGHFTRTSWIRIYINIYTHAILYEYYTFILVLCSLILRRIINICITYSRTAFLCLAILLALGLAKRTLYYSLFAILLLTFEDIRIQRKQSGENSH